MFELSCGDFFDWRPINMHTMLSWDIRKYEWIIFVRTVSSGDILSYKGSNVIIFVRRVPSGKCCG